MRGGGAGRALREGDLRVVFVVVEVGVEVAGAEMGVLFVVVGAVALGESVLIRIRGGGFQSSAASRRLIGRWRERIDWTGGVEYFLGIRGGLEGGDAEAKRACCCCVIEVPTVVQLKWLFFGLS